MGPLAPSCHNPDRLVRGQPGPGNIVHGREGRCLPRSTCGRTFAATRDAPSCRPEKSLDLVTIVVALPCHGCPAQAVVAAFGLDARTAADRCDRSGRHGQLLHEHRALRGQVESGHVQADEL
jgi:hypothetical protein